MDYGLVKSMTHKKIPANETCYQIPGTITKDGNQILGGTDIDEQDYEFIAKIYPKQ